MSCSPLSRFRSQFFPFPFCFFILTNSLQEMFRDFQIDHVRDLLNNIMGLRGLITMEHLRDVFNFILNMLGYVKDFHMGYNALLKFAGMISGFTWIKVLIRRKNQELYIVKYKSTKIQTLVTPDPNTVSNWCRNLIEKFQKEGVARTGAICIFNIPRKKKEVSRSFYFCYILVFVPPDNCLVFAVNNKCTIPIPLSDLFSMSNTVFYVESINKLKKIMHRQCIYNWPVPANLKALETLFKTHYNYPPTESLSFLKMAAMSLNVFDYQIPPWVVSSNWAKGTLTKQYEEIQYLAMRCFSGYLVADEKGWTTGSYLVKVLSGSDDSGESSADDDM